MGELTSEEKRYIDLLGDALYPESPGSTVTINTLVELRKKTEEKAEEIKNKYNEIEDKERSAELRNLITRVFQYAWAERSKLQGVANNSIESVRVERLKEAIEKFTK